MSEIQLSAVVVALNEVHQLPGLMASLRFADEVLLIDGGSTDGTPQRAAELGARVVSRRFDNFAAQRNFGLTMARGEWVLFVDADERPTPHLAREIRRRLGGSRPVAYRVPIRSSIFGRRFRFSGTQDDRPLRLLRRGAAHWCGAVHEVCQTAGPVGQTTGWIEHCTLPDFAAFLTKMNRYTSLEARARVARGITPKPRDAWLMPLYEVLRRLIWKQGFLDGPQGWMFCLLSGLSEWVLANKHRQYWDNRHALSPRGVVQGPIRLRRAEASQRDSHVGENPPQGEPLPLSLQRHVAIPGSVVRKGQPT